MKKVYFSILTFAVCLLSTTAKAGYTHYFTWNQKPNEAELKACIAEMGQIAEARKDILAGRDGPGSPIILSATNLVLNGRGDDEYEDFVFPGAAGFNFCKTAYKPYDEVVTACLITARGHFPPSVLGIDSDGSWADWQEGAKLYSSVLNRTARNPIGGSVLENPSGINNLSDGWLTTLLVICCIMALVVIIELVACVILIIQFALAFFRRLRELRERAVEARDLAAERLQLAREGQAVRKETGELMRRLNARLKYE